MDAERSIPFQQRRSFFLLARSSVCKPIQGDGRGQNHVATTRAVCVPNSQNDFLACVAVENCVPWLVPVVIERTERVQLRVVHMWP